MFFGCHPKETNSDDRLPLNCGCGKCTLDSIMRQPCPSPKSDLLPILSVHPDHVLAMNMNQEWNLQRETREIHSKFRDSLRKTCDQLEESQVSVIKVLRVVKSQIKDPCTIDTVHIDDYSKLQDFLCNQISWFQYRQVTQIVHEFLYSNEDIKSIWKEYTEELTSYAKAKNRALDYEGVQFCSRYSHTDKVLMVALDPAYAIKLSDVPDLRDTLCRIIGEDCIYFYRVYRGSIIFEFIVTMLEKERLFLFTVHPFSRNQLNELTKLNIISLHFEGTCVFVDLELWNPLFRMRLYDLEVGKYTVTTVHACIVKFKCLPALK